MITKEQARKIYNLHSQIENSNKMISQLKEIGETMKNQTPSGDVIKDKYSFSGSIKLEIPDWMTRNDKSVTSCTIYDISIDDAILVLESHVVRISNELRELNDKIENNGNKHC